MPIVQEMEINFDEMSDEQLEAFLANLREASGKRQPKMEAAAKVKISKKPRAFINVQLKPN